MNFALLSDYSVYICRKSQGLGLLFRGQYIFLNLSQTNLLQRILDQSYAIITFGYTWRYICRKLPHAASYYQYITLKDLFRYIFPHSPNNFDRKLMANQLKIKLAWFEPHYPQASPEQTVRLYYTIHHLLAQIVQFRLIQHGLQQGVKN